MALVWMTDEWLTDLKNILKLTNQMTASGAKLEN